MSAVPTRIVGALALALLFLAAGQFTVSAFLAPTPNRFGQVVHPPPPPTATDFVQPPSSDGRDWQGPKIVGFPVRCWHVEPTAPDRPVGGVLERQKVTAYASVDLGENEIDRTFRQTEIRQLAGGGDKSAMSQQDLPSGFFVSFRGHPIYKVTKISYPAQAVPLFLGGMGRAVAIDAEFLHAPSMGECYLYAAVWTARRLPVGQQPLVFQPYSDEALQSVTLAYAEASEAKRAIYLDIFIAMQASNEVHRRLVKINNGKSLVFPQPLQPILAPSVLVMMHGRDGIVAGVPVRSMVEFGTLIASENSLATRIAELQKQADAR